jgi:hypothetical protein
MPLTYGWNSKAAANLPNEIVWDFGVAGNRFNGAVELSRPAALAHPITSHINARAAQMTNLEVVEFS